MPSGGVTAESMAAYLACPAVAAVGGTWIARKEALAAGDWQEVRHRAQEAHDIVAKSWGGRF
jgi:2-dehydro-3-deoxyphosphogluconate aldolase/(4S)-4-hydroxy-2-oxoglutarate aldolase